MAGAIQSIIDFFVSIATLLWSLVRGLATMIQMIPSALGMVNTSIASMPLVLVAFASAAITISVVYLIVGR